MDKSAMNMTARVMFRLLPIQVLLAAMGAINGIVTGLFAANTVGKDAMTAVGLYSPIGLFVMSVSTVFLGGAMILCGQYMGRAQKDRTQNVFSIDLIACFVVAGIITLFHVAVTFLPGGFLTHDPAIWALFRPYLLGQAIGVIPLILGNHLAAFLSLENNLRRATAGSVIFIAVNVVLSYVFLVVLDLEAFGLALAASLGLWVFFIVVAGPFVSGQSGFRLSLKNREWKECLSIFKIGLPGALGNIYQTLRGLIVNGIILSAVGSAGLSAFATSGSLLGLVWAVPGGMLSVSRMFISVAQGEEDRTTLVDIMRTAMYWFFPLMTVIGLVVTLLAVPLTRLYYRDVSDPVFQMTVNAFRILPLCMPLSLISTHFSCYWQSSERLFPVYLIAFLDGWATVSLFSFLLVRVMGMNGVYWANVINGVVSAIAVAVYAAVKLKKIPANMAELMVIPDSFGVSEDARIDISFHNKEEISHIAEKIQKFCLGRGIEQRRAYFSGLAMEEMAANVYENGFGNFGLVNSADIRVAHKDDDVILVIKDDCLGFDPQERLDVHDEEDDTKNIGIRMVYSIARQVTYRKLLGLNVLTIRM